MSAFFPIICLNLESFGFVAIATSPNSVSGRVVETVKNSSEPLMRYLISYSFTSSSIDITSRSESAVFREVSQLTSLFPRYINPSSYNVTKVLATTSETSGSMVNFALSQSTEDPNLFIWLMIFSPDSLRQCQTLSRNASRPISSLLIPSFFKSCSTTN